MMTKKLCDIVDIKNIIKDERTYRFDIGEFADSCYIKGIEIYKSNSTCHIKLVSEKLADHILLKKIEDHMKLQTGFSDVKIDIEFKNCDPADYYQDIIFEALLDNHVLLPVFKDSEFEFVGELLLIRLKGNGADVLNIKKIDTKISEIIAARFAKKVRVSFKADNNVENKGKDIYREAAKKAIKHTRKATQKNKVSLSQILLGTNIKTDTVQIASIDSNDENVTICGEVFRFDKRKINSGRMLFSFGVYDKTSSIYVKAIFDEDKNPELAAFEGDRAYLKIRGRIQYDTYIQDKILMARDICRTPTIQREDRSEVKRAELHAHTQMSAMDAVCDTKKLISRAAGWGHPAIAITDHGVLHAYPDAYEAAKEHSIKVIYGLEGYLAKSDNEIVDNCDDRELDCQYTVIDIETTGLSVKYDKITEIGAVKIKNGQIIDVFTSFVDPMIPIPAKVTELTGITDTMLKDADTIDKVLPGLVRFIGDDCIVAHNSSFDLAFIRREADKLGIKVQNPVADTLEMSRILLPELKRNRLGTVARRLKIKVETQHRALGDATTTAHVLKKFLEIVKYKKNLTHLSDLNTLKKNDSANKNSKIYHVIILVKNETGLKNLYKIVSRSQIDFFYKRPQIPQKLLSEHREGLIIGSACEKGEIYQAVLDNIPEDELIGIASYYDYIELQPVSNNLFLIKEGLVKDVNQLENINKKIIAIAKKAGRPVAATSDSHFIDEEDSIFRQILQTGEGYDDAKNQTNLFLRTTDEMLDEFKYLGEEQAYEIVVENTRNISDSIEDVLPIPKGTYPPKIDNSDTEIKRLVYEKAHEIYGPELHERINLRIEKELDSIIKHGFSVMYNIAQKLVKKSLDDGFLVGSRGSVGSSFAAFLAGITEVNSLSPHYVCRACKYTEFIDDISIECGFDLPDKSCPECKISLKKDGYDIPFETFLGFDGDKEPDIDLNFSGQYQARAHKYVEELFGKDHVFRAGTVSKLALQTAFGYVKKYIEVNALDLPKSEVDRLTDGCMGVRKTTGQHPGGMMIIPSDMEVYDFTAVGYPADDPESGIITTHFDYHFLHGCILKLDILGHDDPTMINMLERYTGIKAETVDIGDKTVMELFRSAKPLGIDPEEIGGDIGTIGIPEFGTSFVRSMLLETRPDTYAELIKISGLSHGTDVWLGNAQKLIKDKTATLKEAICCRDDIMIYLIHMGVPTASAFKIMENVRKGKGLSDEMKADMKKAKVPEWYIWSCEQIKYMFPKAHAAAYVSMAFRIAWYKLYQPLGYYAAYFSTRSDEFDSKMMIHGPDRAKEHLKSYKGIEKATQREKSIITILEAVIEMYARGYEFLNVDIYKSDAHDFIIEKGRLRPPLRALCGLGVNAAVNISKERESAGFLSVEDLSHRARISKTVIEIMHEEGCLAGLSESNQLSLF